MLICKKKLCSIFASVIILGLVLPVSSFRKYNKDDVRRLREEVREMFQHAYDGYLRYAKNYDELRPLSCDGIDTWGSYSLTLIDALDTLAVMGNYTEFRRVVDLLTKNTNFDTDINVSVFETNIRIVGGLLSAHLISHKAGLDLEPGWPCNGPLLRLAEDVAKRLLPAFDTKTGMPYGTVNLKTGVPVGETSVTCTAGVGTFIVEFGALSRLTGDPIYEEVALNALYALWNYKSPIGLFGNHIDVQSGRWTAQDAGIGAGVDSYYEYLVKGSIMLNRPELLEMFHEGRKAIDKYLKRDDWHIWVSMNKGQVTLPVFQSLEAYWPGVLSLIGDTDSAMKTLLNYHSVWRQYGFLPEFYNIPTAEAGANRENYPLRPELIESVMYLYRSTNDPYLLEVGEDILRSIQYSAKTSCGYATIKNVRDHRKEDRMESFFLAETTKYLYLLFDPDNFINNDGHMGTVIQTPNGECVLDAGGYIFNTEAHPIDPAALRCCYDMPKQNLLGDFRVEKYLGDILERKEKEFPPSKCEQENIPKQNIEIVVDLNAPMASEIISEFAKQQIYDARTKFPDPIEVATMANKKAQEINVKTVVKEQNIFDSLENSPRNQSDFQKLRKKFNEHMTQFESQIVMLKKLLEIITQSNTTTEEFSENIFDHVNETSPWEDSPEIAEYESAFIGYAENSLMWDIVDFLGANYKGEDDKVLTIILEIFYSNDPANTAQRTEDHKVLYDRFLTAQAKYEKFVMEKRIESKMMSFFQKFSEQDFGNKTILNNINSILIQAEKKKEEISHLNVTTFNRKLFSNMITLIKAMVVTGKLNESKISGKSKSEQDDEDLIVVQSTEKESELDKHESKISKSYETAADDIILAVKDTSRDESALDTEPNIGTGTVEPITLGSYTSDSVTQAEIRNESVEENSTQDDASDEKSPEAPNTKVSESIVNNSILTDFVQSLLKSTMSTRKKFEPQLLLEKIRSQGLYLNKTQDFSLFTCRAQPFLQRISIHGEFF